MEQGLLRIEEAAQVLALGRSKTYELVATGQLPVVKIGRSSRIPAAALRRWIDRQSADAEARLTSRSYELQPVA